MNVEVAAALLGVEVDASKEQVMSAFKARSRLVHPDMFEAESKSKATAEESMKQLNIAKDVMVKHLENPSASSRSSSFDSAKASPSSSNPNKKAKPESNVEEFEETEITLEEQIEKMRFERKQEVDKAREVMKTISVMFSLNLGVLIVLVATLVFIGMVLVNGWNWLVAVLGAVVVAGVVWMWRRVVERYYALTYTVGEFLAHKRESRREERMYKKSLKPERTEGFIYQAKKFKDKF